MNTLPGATGPGLEKLSSAISNPFLTENLAARPELVRILRTRRATSCRNDERGYPVNIRMMRLPDVVRATGLGRSTIYAKVAAGEFPAPVKLGARAVAWPESVVAEWLANRPSARAA